MSYHGVSTPSQFSSREPFGAPEYTSSVAHGGLPLIRPPLENGQEMIPGQIPNEARGLEAGPKIRLRKACDSCAVRKVKCDETGPPCRACAASEIPCTFIRPSRRRGPPNRHAEAIKKLQLHSPGTTAGSNPSSPTYTPDAVASFSPHQGLSAEAILPFSILELFVSDYFTYLHPLIPIPHEPSFRDAFQKREDLSNSTFLALLASMVGCLVASFPRRPRKHLKAHQMETLFPNSMSLVERCHKVTIEALGLGYLDRDFTLHDAVISYLQGLTGAYTYNWHAARVYFGQCLTISRMIGLHQGRGYGGSGSAGSSSSTNFSSGDDGLRSQGANLILQEIGRRTFWLIFVSLKSIQQLSASSGEYWMPPTTPAEPYPPLPLEVDDAYLTPTHVLPQPQGMISMLVGFNANVRIFSAYNTLSTFELTSGVDESFDWERQTRILEQSLRETKRILDELPQELRLNPKSRFAKARVSEYPAPIQLHGDGKCNVHQGESGLTDIIDERRRVQHEIQKANIYATQLATRSYLVEKYWNLHRSHVSARWRAKSTSHPPETNPEAFRRDSHQGESSCSPDLTDQRMANEREDIVKDLLNMLGMVSQVDIEPNGASFMHKVRQIASTLLEVPRSDTGQYTLCAKEYLNAFLEVLLKLELASPVASTERDDPTANHPSATTENDDEETQLRHWAGLSEYQRKFAEAGGFLSEI